MKITIVSHNLSSNALGRAYILAKALKNNYEIEFIGLVDEKGIWPPCDTGEFEYKTIKKSNFFKNIFGLYSLVTGDVIYAVKPLPASFGVGLLCKFVKRKPLVLDIDDWELGFVKEEFAEKKISFLKYWVIYLRLFILEKMVVFADRITTVSKYLNKKFGNRGVFVPHGRDVNVFDPKKFNQGETKKKLGLADSKIVMFLGSIRPHKGLEDLLAVAEQLRDKKLKVVLVGVDFNDPWIVGLIEKHESLVKAFGYIKFDEIPSYLSAADVVVIPQRESLGSNGQIPAKIFDAMAMAKPVISTNTSDIPKILEGCGIVVSPGNVEELRQALDLLLKDPTRAEEYGVKARAKCIENYSLAVMESRLKEVFQDYENR